MAAAQIAAENGLGPEAQHQLEQQLLQQLRRKAAEEAANLQAKESTNTGHYPHTVMADDFSQARDEPVEFRRANHIRRPGYSPRVSGKPTASPPSANQQRLPSMAAGGYRSQSACNNPNMSSISGGIFG